MPKQYKINPNKVLLISCLGFLLSCAGLSKKSETAAVETKEVTKTKSSRIQ